MNITKRNINRILEKFSKIDLWQIDVRRICRTINESLDGNGFAIFSDNRLNDHEDIPGDLLPPDKKSKKFLSFNFPINRFVSRIFIYYKKGIELSTQQYNEIQNLVSILAKAISIRQVSKDRIIESQIINELNLNIVTTLDEKKIIKQLETAARRMLATEKVLLFYSSDDKLIGTSKFLKLKNISVDIYNQLFNNRQIFTIEHPHHWFLDQLLEKRVEQVTFVPFIIKNEVRGFFLLFDNSKKIKWNPAITHLRFLANQSAIALERLELIHALNRALKESHGLQGLTKMMMSTSELHLFFNELLKQVQRLLGFKQILFSLYNPQTKCFDRTSGVGIAPKKLLAAKKVHPPTEIINTLFQNRYRIANSYYIPVTKVDKIVRDYQLYKSPTPPKERLGNLWNRGDILISPIYSRNRELLAFLSLGRPINNLVPSADKIKLLETFGDFLGLAIENNQLFEKIERLSNLDELTGIYNYRFLRDKLSGFINEDLSTFSIIMIDLDNFKEYNDRFGHLRGDEILKKISKFLVEVVGPNGFVTRYGGDEFIILLPGIDSKAALNFINKITNSLNRYKAMGIPIFFSCGIASYPNDGKNFGDLIDRADKVLYLEKAKKHNEDKS